MRGAARKKSGAGRVRLRVTHLDAGMVHLSIEGTSKVKLARDHASLSGGLPRLLLGRR